MKKFEIEVTTNNHRTKVIGFGKGSGCIMRTVKDDADTMHILNNSDFSSDDIAQELCDNIESLIIPFISDADKVVLISCLGKRGGLVLSKTIERIKEECLLRQTSLIVFLTLPFIWEGKTISNNAQKCMKEISSVVDDMLVVDNNECVSGSMADIFGGIDKKFSEFVK